MRGLVLTLFIILIICLQGVVFPHLEIAKVMPDLLFLTVILWGLFRGPWEALLLGLGLGFLQDVFSCSLYIHTFSKPLIGMMAGLLRESFYSESYPMLMISVFVGTLLGSVMEVGILYLTSGQILWAFPYIIIIQALYSSFLTPLFSPLVRYVCRPARPRWGLLEKGS